MFSKHENVVLRREKFSDSVMFDQVQIAGEFLQRGDMTMKDIGLYLMIFGGGFGLAIAIYVFFRTRNCRPSRGRR